MASHRLPSGLCMGKHPATYSPFTMKLKTYLLPSTLPTLPVESDWSLPVPTRDVNMLLNGPNTYAPAKAPNGLGCCVVAGALNKLQNDSATSGTIRIASDADCLAIYEAQGGYVPGDESTDRGLNMLNFMTAWRDTGLTLADGSVSKIGAFVSIDLADPDERRMAQHLSGTILLGVQLPASAERQFNAGQPYAIVPFSSIAGGHCVAQLKYDATYDYIENWARLLQPVEPSWTHKYLDEAYAVLDTAYWVKTNSCPAGIDGDHLLADLKQLGN